MNEYMHQICSCNLIRCTFSSKSEISLGRYDGILVSFGCIGERAYDNPCDKLKRSAAGNS